MKEDDDILAELGAKFPFLQGKMRIQRIRRIQVEVTREQIPAVFAHLFGPMRFMMMSAMTGLDAGAQLLVLYHLARESGVLLSLSLAVPKEQPIIQTVTPYFPAADAYERELVDMLGMKVEGLPPGSRYPLPDGWPEGQYPLRKDWTAKQLEGTAFAAGITYPGEVAGSPAKEAARG